VGTRAWGPDSRHAPYNRLARLELQSTRFEAAELAETNAALTRERRLVTSSASKLREDVCREVLALRQARAAEEQLKASQRESALEARKVPQLEKELSRCKRELAAATRRSSLLVHKHGSSPYFSRTAAFRLQRRIRR
jgi:hypothetical protein